MLIVKALEKASDLWKVQGSLIEAISFADDRGVWLPAEMLKRWE